MVIFIDHCLFISLPRLEERRDLVVALKAAALQIHQGFLVPHGFTMVRNKREKAFGFIQRSVHFLLKAYRERALRLPTVTRHLAME